MDLYKQSFKNKKIMVTGGLGFIGSNLVVRLVELGAEVTVVDCMIPDYGGNLFNIAPVVDKVIVNYCDIRDINAMNHLVREKDYIFHLAGQVCHVMSLTDPFPDIEINITGTTILMEACKQYNRQVKVIYTGTRGEYGSATHLPVNEEAPTNPRGIHEISNLTAEKIIKIYNDVHGIQSVMLRLTNTYGPRAQMKHSRFGVANWFIRLAIDDDKIPVFGDGKILRDFLFVDDAVEAILMTAINPAAIGEIINVGVDVPTTFLILTQKIIKIAGTGRWEFAPFTPERAAQEPGDFYSDITKIRQKIGWEPKVTLEDGIKKTIEYYRKFKSYYW